MYRANRAFLTVFLSLALVNISLFSIIPDKVKAPEQFKTYPSSVTVTSGTATGSVPDDVSFEDGNFYTVVEEDVGVPTIIEETIGPNATGTFSEWDGGVGPVNCDAATHWGCVDEGPPSPGDENTTYVFSTLTTGGPTVFETDTYNATDLLEIIPITQLEVFGTALEVAPPPNGVDCAMCVFSGTTLSCGTPIGLIQAWQETSVVFTTDPDTGLAWTLAGINATEIGIQLSWPGPGASPESRITLVYGIVTHAIEVDDFTAVFQFDFLSIQGSEDPELEIKGLRTGDTEAILVQVLRSGTWITLSSDAFETTLTTSKFGLSTTDVLGGSASVRIIDSDITDDTQTTISIDEIVILTGGKANNPSSAISVSTRSEYRPFENRLLVHLFWTQSGGPEEAFAIDKWVTVFIDGHLVGKGIFRVKEDHTFVLVPWGVLDGGLHNGTVRGFVLINWSTGPTVHTSVPEEITLDNFLRWLLIVTIGMVILIAVIAWAIKVMNERRLDKEMLRR